MTERQATACPAFGFLVLISAQDQLQAALIANPQAGDVVPGSGECASFDGKRPDGASEAAIG